MDPDRQKLTDAEIKIIKQTIYTVPNDGDFFPAIWLRRLIQANNGVDRFLLESGRSILLYLGPILWLIYIISL